MKDNIRSIENEQCQEEEQRSESNLNFNGVSTNQNNSEINENSIDTDDDYDLSDDSDILQAIGGSNSDFHMRYSSAIVDNSAHLINTLTDVLDSVKLDKSLAIQTRTSGKLNHKNQKIIDKTKELNDRLHNLKTLYEKNFEVRYDKNLNKNISRIDILKSNIADIENRIEKLTNGHNSNSRKIFRFKPKEDTGVQTTFPIEFNQAKDKVLERQIGENI